MPLSPLESHKHRQYTMNRVTMNDWDDMDWKRKELYNKPTHRSNNDNTTTGMIRTLSMTSLTVTNKGGTNKDSSRDSAYGFSSGESRITTRESTPEKNTRMKSCLSKSPQKDYRLGNKKGGPFKSTLSTVESSINQDYCPSSRALSSASIALNKDDWACSGR